MMINLLTYCGIVHQLPDAYAKSHYRIAVPSQIDFMSTELPERVWQDYIDIILYDYTNRLFAEHVKNDDIINGQICEFQRYMAGMIWENRPKDTVHLTFTRILQTPDQYLGNPAVILAEPEHIDQIRAIKLKQVFTPLTRVNFEKINNPVLLDLLAYIDALVSNYTIGDIIDWSGPLPLIRFANVYLFPFPVGDYPIALPYQRSFAAVWRKPKLQKTDDAPLNVDYWNVYMLGGFKWVIDYLVQVFI